MTTQQPISLQILRRSLDSLRGRRSLRPSSGMRTLRQNFAGDSHGRRPGRSDPGRFEAVSRLLRRSNWLLNVQSQVSHRSYLSIVRHSVGESPVTLALNWTSPVLRQTLQRLTERTVLQDNERHWHRLERSTAHRSERVTVRESVVRREEGSGLPRLALTLVRSAPLPPKAISASEGADAAHAQPARERMDDARTTRSVRSESPMLAEHEISRLTDCVVRQLDRRVLSYRERHGII